MARSPKGAKLRGRPKTVGDGEQVSVRLDQATLDVIEKIIRLAGFGTRAQVIREAVAIGAEQIRRRYER